MVALLHDEAPRLESGGDPLLKEIDALIQRCLVKDPLDRPHDGGDLGDEIRELFGGQQLTRPSRAAGKRRVRATTGVAIAVVALLIIAAAAVLVSRANNRQLDQGFDLRASDIRGDGETRRLIGLALRADADGNRAKAIELLEEAQRRDSKTAFPAGFLSSFSDASGNYAEGQQWTKAALARLPGASTYESLLVRYLIAENGERSRELALAKSMLEIRPRRGGCAWPRRTFIWSSGTGRRPGGNSSRSTSRSRTIGASCSCSRIERPWAISKARSGTCTPVDWSAGPRFCTTRRRASHGVAARWSVRALYDRAADDAAAEGLAPLETEARMLAGVSLLRLGNWSEAQRRFASAGLRARQAGLTSMCSIPRRLEPMPRTAPEISGSGIARVAAAIAVNPPASPAASLRLLAIRLRSPVWKDWSTEAMAASPSWRRHSS